MNTNKNKIWLGKGFPWTQQHAQMSFEVLKQDIRKVLPKHIVEDEDFVGSPWIHGLEMKRNEIDLMQRLDHSSLMTLIVGTTGSGKTRTFETLITQAVLRGETVIIIDPKGDRDLCETARRACKIAGDEERFLFFHPAFPEDSVRIDPLYNFNNPTEIASRVSEVIPEGSDSGPFKSFGFMAINNIVQGLLFGDERPNLMKIRKYLEGGPDHLVIRALTAYFNNKIPGWDTDIKKNLLHIRTINKKAIFLSNFYYEKVQEEFSNPDIEGLLTMFNHDREHFGKMIASTLPVLNTLTSGDVGKMLSPDIYDTEDERLITDTTRIINMNQVLYMGLDSLSNNTVGASIGSIFLADLASVAGARYNYETNMGRVNIFVDEAAECLNDKLIQILNKGRGSNLNVYLATQTIADFKAKMGDEAKAMQFLGNLNNLIALRTIDNDTQEYITTNLYKTRIQYLMRTQGSNTESGSAMMHGGNVGERLMEEEAELFPPQLLGMLPNLEYIAKLAGGKVVKGRIPILKES
jgi:conjugal transfer pilus assembly protein TraD